MSKRALVSGGAGFIGSHVADVLLAEGYHVEILDNLSSGRRENVPAGAVFHHMDIGSEDAARVVREGRFDALFHLAAQIDVRKSVLDPAGDARINSFFVNTEMLTRARKQGLSIAEIGVTHRPRRGGESKVSVMDVPRVLRVLIPFWWSGGTKLPGTPAVTPSQTSPPLRKSRLLDSIWMTPC